MRLLLQHGATGIAEDEAKFQPAANAVLRQWHALSPARQEIVRRYDWSFVDLPAEWTVRHHHQYPSEFRQRLAAAALALGGPLGALNGKPGDLMYQMAGDLHGLMGFGVEPHELKKQPCAKCKLKVGSRLCSACHQIGYCSRECQKAHWKAHKAECKRHQTAK